MDDRTRRTKRGWVMAAAIVAAAMALPGCSRALFSQRDERTQFDRYDRSQNQFEQQWTEDEFGHRQPNLRGRLEPKQ